MLPKLRGMFAIGIWDAPNRKLFLFRDRLGVKPLLYAVRGNTLAFASTARALHEAGFAPEIDLDGESHQPRRYRRTDRHRDRQAYQKA